MTQPDNDQIREVSESRYLADLDWIQVGTSVILHAPLSWSDDAIMHGYDPEAVTKCGITGPGVIPGVLSRMGCRRCGTCCDALGYPRGKGSPKNDPRCRELLGLGATP